MKFTETTPPTIRTFTLELSAQEINLLTRSVGLVNLGTLRDHNIELCDSEGNDVFDALYHSLAKANAVASTK